ncbi:5-methyltetrahydropteroyltriglutamate--homocysteine S-methyltransferase [Amnibacterium sp. CER49]|uniref:5-methyltetrahydropteroyltriglutamate-- homocysteine S-methyltransferase n=1 Tax=Amnibacterium sp. CER49 TaxID=3039161 RepID=UPI0024499FC5|nr:5-methyltetrahydropteroyltriglutamate--homocysteine S-methyltransferase [Amnibacterium sp. CER49]MDH2444834.1 5-methyltetrahydropteroyltriglutamate--homocysteine S-methyltransferase [Amnibacterium sp. CER49]
MTDLPIATVLGYPRIGRRRELKHALEAYWAGRIDAAELERRAAASRAAVRRRLVELGLDAASGVPESFSLYDQVLDTALAVGAVPGRFGAAAPGALDTLFALARGTDEQPPLEMTKWFDSNYHYLVPEIDESTTFTPNADRLAALVGEAVAEGLVPRPVLVGPVTLLALSKDPSARTAPLERLDDLLPVYAAVLRALADAGAEWVQLDEPALVSESLAARPAELADAAARTYGVLGAADGRPSLLVAATWGTLPAPALRALATSPVEAVALDLVRGDLPVALDDEVRAGLAAKTLVAGVVDGRNVWRADLAVALDRLDAVAPLARRLVVSTAASLLHVPHDVDDEPDLPAPLRRRLAFADQKVREVALLARAVERGRASIAEDLADSDRAIAEWAAVPGVRIPAVRRRVEAVGPGERSRAPYPQRVAAQHGLGLPPLPTTTIGSFPQTDEVRRLRVRLAKGELTAEAYETAIRDEIARVIELQEDLGLDVLVHGEPERNDMVQYFAEALDGFATTVHGWVQSYGSRCTRPSILWGDVTRPAPITVRWSRFAQSRTPRPVKGMLTGPVTILAWSFVRDDQPLGATADQVALALRDEIADLEAAGIRIVQVDEPALRELLPLSRARQPEYLRWSVGAFRLATGGAAPSTQVHTHLCYSEFAEVIDAIDGLDADVTSIEASRSRMEVVDAVRESGFARGIGPGVWDIHSPRVPGEQEVASHLAVSLAAVPADRLWVNPDCGLKTRGYEETVASLTNLVSAARAARARLTVAEGEPA